MAAAAASASHPLHHQLSTHRHDHDDRYASYGGNPLAHSISSSSSVSARFPASAATFQVGLYKEPPFKFANPVPLGLSGFALTTFLLSAINLGTRGLVQPTLVIGPSLAYGGFVQLLAGMWDVSPAPGGSSASMKDADRSFSSGDRSPWEMCSAVRHCRPTEDSGSRSVNGHIQLNRQAQ